MEVDNYWETKANELDKQDTKNKEIIADLLKANKKLIQANDELKEANLRLLHRLEANNKDINLIYQLEKELGDKRTEINAAIAKDFEYRQTFRRIEDIIISVKSDPSYYPKEQKIYMWCQKVLDIIDKNLKV